MTFNWYQKLKSGALQFTLFIAILIALLLSALILYAYTFTYMKEQSKATVENIQLSSTGINYLLNHNVAENDTLQLDDIGNENQNIKVHLSHWGILEKAMVITQHRKKKFLQTAIIGSEINSADSPTLYLQETFNPLTLVGNTIIRGNAYLPSQGVKSGYIAGESYYGSQLIYGTTKKSDTILPKLSKSTLETIEAYFTSSEVNNQQDFSLLQSNHKIVNSFKEKTKSTSSRSIIILENCDLTGNIIIKSDTLIRVKKSAKLQDILLIAPIVEIENQVNGCFQVIAKTKITVGKECKLNYPSALLLYQDNKNYPDLNSNIDFNNQIFIDSNTLINGTVCYIQSKIAADYNTQLVLEKASRIKGLVYCMGNFEIKGTVSGSVFTKQFTANQAGSIFLNHIYHGTIENINTPSKYAGAVFENQTKAIVKWMY